MQPAQAHVIRVTAAPFEPELLWRRAERAAPARLEPGSRRGESVRALIQMLAIAWAIGSLPPLLECPTVAGATYRPASERAQAAAEAAPPAAKPDPSRITVNVAVVDEDGYAVTGLKRDNFWIYDNGNLHPLVDFAPASEPVTIAVLMEYSSSYYGYFAGKAADWTAGFVNHLEPHDWVALVTYDLNSKVRIDFTHNRAEVQDTLRTLGSPFFHEANLFDALVETLDKMERVRGKKSILLVATGSNSFSANTLEDVLERLKRTDVKIFCIGLAEQEYIRSSSGGSSYVQARAWLDEFADLTGGVAMFPRFEGELPGIFDSVLGLLRSEYSLTFKPGPQLRDGRFHKLKIEVVDDQGKRLKVTNQQGKRRDVKIYAREGYLAAKAATEANK